MFNKFITVTSLVAGTLGLLGCSTTATFSEKLSLEMQEYQSKFFEIDKKTAFISTISVFQDLGFIINSANYEIGFITADNFDMQIATASFEDYEKSIKIRLNFKLKTTNNSLLSNSSALYLSDERRVYDRFFDKVEETIFIKFSNKQNYKFSSKEDDLNNNINPIENKNSAANISLDTQLINAKNSLTSPVLPIVPIVPIVTNEYYTTSFANDYYKTIKGDTLDKIIKKTVKDSPLKIELLREAFVLQNPLKLSMNIREIIKVGTEIKIPRNDYIIPKITVQTDDINVKAKAIEDSRERSLDKLREESRKWIRFP